MLGDGLDHLEFLATVRAAVSIYVGMALPPQDEPPIRSRWGEPSRFSPAKLAVRDELETPLRQAARDVFSPALAADRVLRTTDDERRTRITNGARDCSTFGS